MSDYIPSPLFTGSLARDIFQALERKRAEKKGFIAPPVVPQVHVAPQIPAAPQDLRSYSSQKKSGWGLAFLIVGSGLFIFYGIPLLQGKGAYKPGMTRPPGYVPTRKSPGEE